MQIYPGYGRLANLPFEGTSEWDFCRRYSIYLLITNTPPTSVPNDYFCGRLGAVLSRRVKGSLPLEQLFHPAQMPVDLKVVPGGRTKCGIQCESSLHPNANVDSRLRILRQRFVRLHVLGNVMVQRFKVFKPNFQCR